MKTVTAGVLDIAYRETGPTDGLPTVLLHGFPYDIHAFDAVAERLAVAGHRCILPFLRGYGATRFRFAQTLRSGEQAALGADLLALLDALAIDRALLGGYDWGGRAACVVSALWPERVLGLVSCGTGYNIQNIAAAGQPVSPETEARYCISITSIPRAVARRLSKIAGVSANISGRSGRQAGPSAAKPLR